MTQGPFDEPTRAQPTGMDPHADYRRQAAQRFDEPTQAQPTGMDPHADYRRQAAQHFDTGSTQSSSLSYPVATGRVNSVVKGWNIGRDAAAGALVFLALLFPWNVYFGVGIRGSNAGIWALLILVTLLSWGSIAATYVGFWRMFGSRFDPDLVRRVRLALNIPYVLLVGGFIVFDIIDTIGHGDSWTPGGVGPGAWFGTAGALLAGQSVITDLLAVDRLQRLSAVTRIVAYASMGIATVGVLLGLFWTVKIVHAQSNVWRTMAVLSDSVVASLVSLAIVALAGWWMTQQRTGARLTLIALGASVLAAGCIVTIMPFGGDIDAFHGIAQHTSTAGVGYPGYLAWVAAAALLAPMTLAHLWTAKPVDKEAVHDAARNVLLLIAAWCAGRVLIRIIDFIATIGSGASVSLYYTIALFAFDLVTAALAVWLRTNLTNATLPTGLIATLCGVLAVLTFARMIVGATLGGGALLVPGGFHVPVLGRAMILGHQLNMFDLVLLLLAFGVLAVTLVTSGLLAGLLSQLQLRSAARGSTPATPPPDFLPPDAADVVSSVPPPQPLQPEQLSQPPRLQPEAPTEHVDTGAAPDPQPPVQPPPSTPLSAPAPPPAPAPVQQPFPASPAAGQGMAPVGYLVGPPRTTNGMAIAALVCSLVLAPLGIIFGHVALSQIKRTGQSGRGMAIAGLVIGYIFTAISLIWIVVVVVAVVGVVNDVNDTIDDFDSSFNDDSSYYDGYAATTTYGSLGGPWVMSSAIRDQRVVGYLHSSNDPDTSPIVLCRNEI